MKNRSGFTLLELLIVVMILGILVAIALPLYTKAMEKGRMAEAVANLGALRSAEIRYYVQYDKTTTVTNDLDWSAPDPDLAVVRFADYSVTGTPIPGDPLSGLSYQCTRNTIEKPGYITAYTVQMDANGNVSGGP